MTMPGSETLLQGLILSLETSANQVLVFDPASRKKIANIQEVLCIQVTAPKIKFYCCGSEDGIRLMSHCELPVAAQLSGSVADLLSVLKQPDNLARSDVDFVGSTGVLQKWQDVLQTLDIDWEDAISQILGDIAGPLAASGIRSSAQWTQSQIQEHVRLLGEYITEEQSITPSRTEVTHFFEQVSDLKLDADRLSAKLSQLRKKVMDNTA